MDWKAVWKREHEEAFRAAKSAPVNEELFWLWIWAIVCH